MIIDEPVLNQLRELAARPEVMERLKRRESDLNAWAEEAAIIAGENGIAVEADVIRRHVESKLEEAIGSGSLTDEQLEMVAAGDCDPMDDPMDDPCNPNQTSTSGY